MGQLVPFYVLLKTKTTKFFRLFSFPFLLHFSQSDFPMPTSFHLFDYFFYLHPFPLLPDFPPAATFVSVFFDFLLSFHSLREEKAVPFYLPRINLSQSVAFLPSRSSLHHFKGLFFPSPFQLQILSLFSHTNHGVSFYTAVTLPHCWRALSFPFSPVSSHPPPPHTFLFLNPPSLSFCMCRPCHAWPFLALLISIDSLQHRTRHQGLSFSFPPFTSTRPQKSSFSPFSRT